MSEVKPVSAIVATEAFLDDAVASADKMLGKILPGDAEYTHAPRRSGEIIIGRGPIEYMGDKFVQGLKWALDKVVQIASSPS